MSDKENKSESQPEIHYIPVPQGQYPYQDDNDEIDLIAIGNKVWRGRKLILITGLIFLVYGLIVAFGSLNEYTSEVKLMPESQQESSFGGLSGLARQFGVSAGQQSAQGTIPPSLYPEIAQSTPFLKRLLDFEITYPEMSERITIRTYYFDYRETAWVDTFKRYTIRLPITIIRAFGSLFSSSDEQEMLSQADVE
ncbi:MAG: Wzz/FepE/Etk N-terminal domain-containing protein, partial [Salibacteraceae bacterium]